jgi:hypothetical protein
MEGLSVDHDAVWSLSLASRNTAVEQAEPATPITVNSLSPFSI